MIPSKPVTEKHLVLDRKCLPPKGCGLFLFCCFLGWRVDPEWWHIYLALAAWRILVAVGSHVLSYEYDIFKTWRK